MGLNDLLAVMLKNNVKTQQQNTEQLQEIMEHLVTDDKHYVMLGRGLSITPKVFQNRQLLMVFYDKISDNHMKAYFIPVCRKYNLDLYYPCLIVTYNTLWNIMTQEYGTLKLSEKVCEHYKLKYKRRNNEKL